MTGNFAKLELPESVMKFILNKYVKFYDVVLEDLDKDLFSYKRFHDFFIREVK